MASYDRSVYIPYMETNATFPYIKYVFDYLKLGEVTSVDFVTKKNASGHIFNMGFVFFNIKDSVKGQEFMNKVNDPGSETKIIISDDYYWICLPNLNPKPRNEELVANQVSDLITMTKQMAWQIHYMQQTIDLIVIATAPQPPTLTKQHADIQTNVWDTSLPIDYDEDSEIGLKMPKPLTRQTATNSIIPMPNSQEYTDPPEKRLDISDGLQYTKQEFIDYYGDTILWEESLLVPEPLYTEEKRLDMIDNNYYTKTQFLDFYGEKEGEKKWEDSLDSAYKITKEDEDEDEDEDERDNESENYQML